MSTAAQVIAVAQGQVGYHEQGNNWTKYWAELEPGLQGAPWCAAFASWVFIHAGNPLPAIDRSYGYISALDAMNWAQAHGYWDASGHYSPGDLIIYGGGEHTGICVSDDGVTIHTVEGNWGDQVCALTRSHGLYVTGVLKASRLLTGSGPTPPQPPTNPNAMVAAIQTAIRIAADGQWGDITSHAATCVIRAVRGTPAEIKYLQARIGATQDGFWGPASAQCWILTIANIQRAIGTTPDGVWGPLSQSAWDRAYAANYRKF